MSKEQLITLLLILVIIVLIYFTNKINKNNLRENFQDNYLDKMDYSNEILVKFCRKLRQLDKPNDFNILLKNMKQKSIDENRDTIDSLIQEIQNLQKDISLHDTDARELYKLDTHNTAKKQVDAVNKAIHNVKNSGNISVNLV
tara:strand:- start:337 stop:765 length:429 start_codon:yes stop_codon:yes gene_type:complete